MTRPPVHVQIVHGASDISFIDRFLIPSLSCATTEPIQLWTLGYDGSRGSNFDCSKIPVTVVERIGTETMGFGASHNQIFHRRGTDEDFVIVNPDCYLLPGSIDQLILRKAGNTRAGIVEGRQWPFEHPKEYDRETGCTPWASGAFALVSGSKFSRIQGFDESFFLYLEDVDLSWRMWLENFEVLYEPRAIAMHFSGGPHYRNDLRSAEEYFGARNFLLLLWKHFGHAELRRGMAIIRSEFSSAEAEQIIADFEGDLISLISCPKFPSKHRMIKVLGFNKFHELRPT